jgi:hypothetical protein
MPMKSIIIRACVCLGLLVIPLAVHADEHPYARVLVGDYATYSIKTKVAEVVVEGIVTQTVTAKTDKEVTVKITGKITFNENQQIIPPREQKLDLSKPFDPTKFYFPLPQGAEVQVQKAREGQEKISLRERSFYCTWTEYNIQAKAPGTDLSSVVKVWISQDIPMGVVKMIMNATPPNTNQKLEVILELKEMGNVR